MDWQPQFGNESRAPQTLMLATYSARNVILNTGPASSGFVYEGACVI